MDNTIFKGYGHLPLGKKPPRLDPRTLCFTDYIKPSKLPVPPAYQFWYQKVNKWGMMLNDTLGDCTCAAIGHGEQTWTSNATSLKTPTDQAILRAYEAVGGYSPGDPSTDNGAVILDVLKYWHNTGIALDEQPHKIAAFASIPVGWTAKDHNIIKTAIDLFGFIDIGVQLPITAQDQKCWSVVPNAGPNGVAGSWGGHSICVNGYSPTVLWGITWGELIPITWDFASMYFDEAYICVSPDWLKANKKSPSGLFLDALLKDARVLSSQ